MTYKYLRESKSDSIVFTFGRYQPPTIGHKIVFDAMKKISINKNADFLIYSSHSVDKKKNPLRYVEKIKYLKLLFPEYSNNVKETKSNTIMKILTELYKLKYKSVIMVVGSDRVSDFLNIINTYNGIQSSHGFYEFDTIEVISAQTRDPDSDGVSGMSASKMRSYVAKNDFESFSAGLPTHVSIQNKQKLFKLLQKNMGITPMKYTDEEVLEKLNEELVEGFRKWTVAQLNKSSRNMKKIGRKASTQITKTRNALKSLTPDMAKAKAEIKAKTLAIKKFLPKLAGKKKHTVDDMNKISKMKNKQQAFIKKQIKKGLPIVKKEHEQKRKSL